MKSAIIPNSGVHTLINYKVKKSPLKTHKFWLRPEIMLSFMDCFLYYIKNLFSVGNKNSSNTYINTNAVNQIRPNPVHK